MCTVSFFHKGNNDFILTSNRDEAVGRSTLPPSLHVYDNVEMTYPKDELAGGTWIGHSEQDRLICLLNGAFKKHTRKSQYKKSRGVIVKELLAAENAVDTIEKYDLEGVEPFTIVMVEWKEELKLYELVWDEYEKHFSELPLESKIWCSSTLYTDEMKIIRKQWFEDYFGEKESSLENILNFHEHYGIGDKNLDLQIDRGMLKTVSITSFSKSSDNMVFSYNDLLKTQIHHFEVNQKSEVNG